MSPCLARVSQKPSQKNRACGLAISKYPWQLWPNLNDTLSEVRSWKHRPGDKGAHQEPQCSNHKVTLVCKHLIKLPGFARTPVNLKTLKAAPSRFHQRAGSLDLECLPPGKNYLEKLNWREFLFLCLYDVPSAFHSPKNTLRATSPNNWFKSVNYALLQGTFKVILCLQES